VTDNLNHNTSFLIVLFFFSCQPIPVTVRFDTGTDWTAMLLLFVQGKGSDSLQAVSPHSRSVSFRLMT
jgi:hypothetical protein